MEAETSAAIAAHIPGLPYAVDEVCKGAFYANAVLTKFGLKAGYKILIYGACGAFGTAMVQLARSAGAEVTAVVATRHQELVKTPGADRAVDYAAAISRGSARPSISW